MAERRDPAPDRPAESSEAEGLFLGWLERRERGEGSDFEALCAEHGRLAEDLRRLREDHERARAALGQRPVGRDSTWGRYEIRGEIARGGMGLVLDAWDPKLRRALAIKVLRPPGGDSDLARRVRHERRRSRLLAEAQIQGQLDHPGIVPVHDVDLDPAGEPFFTMPQVRGRSFGEILAAVHAARSAGISAAGAAGGSPADDVGAEWTLTRAVGVLLRACEAVAHAHERGVVHRDLKPDNVMVGRLGETYVMDWGLARASDAPGAADIRLRSERSESVRTDRGSDGEPSSWLRTMEGDVVGTPAYMPPEQAEGRIDAIDARTDVYGAGAMLYHLLSGRRPYAAERGDSTPEETLEAVKHGPPQPLRRVAPAAPEELVAVCERAMQRDPARRYATMGELAGDLRAWLEGRVVLAHRTGPWIELRKWVARNRRLALATLVAFLAALAGLASTAWVEWRANQKLSAQSADLERAWSASQTSEERARQRADEVLRLADQKRLSDLVAAADELWPAHPDRVAAMESWLDDARALLARLELHRATLAALRERAEPAQPAETAVAAEAGGADRTWRFAAAEDRWQHDVLAGLVTTLESLADEEHGLVGDVERRLERARTIAARSITDEEPAARWREAIRSIGDAGECPMYAGLALRPQLGLVPLGRDPASGLWEFAHVETGAIAARDPASGELRIADEIGLVFVLLPGGSFAMGAQQGDPAGRNHDPEAIRDELPVHDVALDPFFLSKYEMTQAQWKRFTGANPSNFFANPGRTIYGKETTWRNPVEAIPWTVAERTIRHLGLELPTEAQWEYAARAGTSSVWWTGSDERSIEGAANIADGGTQRKGGPHWWVYDPWLEDGYVAHAPVGTFLPNAFGLHEIIGNVKELCRDGYAQYSEPLVPGTGERIIADPRSRVSRGGSFSVPAKIARSSVRHLIQPDYTDADLGVRPARGRDGLQGAITAPPTLARSSGFVTRICDPPLECTPGWR